MKDGWTILRTFVTDVEAQEMRGRLESSGIAAMVAVDNCGGMRPHLDFTSGVKLLVPDQEVERARELLQASAAGPAGEAWICPGCGERIEAGFDTCWQCGREMP